MAKKAERKLGAAQLTAQTAEQVFGWKDVRMDRGELVGKRRDKLGRWRTAKVPGYSTNPIEAYRIDEQMKRLGMLSRYNTALSKLTKPAGLPADWATPEQRCRAALTTLGRQTALRLVKR